jgi:hypothetical protein
VIRLVADDEGAVLTEQEITRIQFWVLEVLPATRCEVRRGPGIEIIVPEREPGDLVPAVLRRLEEIVGCALHLHAAPSPDTKIVPPA